MGITFIKVYYKDIFYILLEISVDNVGDNNFIYIILTSYPLLIHGYQHIYPLLIFFMNSGGSSFGFFIEDMIEVSLLFRIL